MESESEDSIIGAKAETTDTSETKSDSDGHKGKRS